MKLNLCVKKKLETVTDGKNKAILTSKFCNQNGKSFIIFISFKNHNYLLQSQLRHYRTVTNFHLYTFHEQKIIEIKF